MSGLAVRRVHLEHCDLDHIPTSVTILDAVEELHSQLV